MKHHDTIRLLPIAILASLASPARGEPPVAQQAPASVSEQGLTVRVGETIGIMEPGETKCAYVAAKKLANGDLIVSMPWPRTGKPIRSVRSGDGGRTWSPSVSSLSRDGGKTWADGPTPVFENFLTLPGGDLIGFDFPNHPAMLWTFNADASRGILRPTRLAEGEDPALFAYQHTMALLADGRVIATSQMIPKGETKSRVPVHVSADKGLTWSYLSTAAAEPDPKHRHEGFTEPRLLGLPNGDLLCFLRTANPDTAGRQGYTYKGLEVARSTDQGRSWSDPATVAPQGVYPDALVTADGVIAVAYGRPDDRIAFSIDHGRTWICDVQVTQAARHPDCGHYNSIIEVSPGRLLLCYGVHAGSNPPQAAVLGTFVEVSKSAAGGKPSAPPPAISESLKDLKSKVKLLFDEPVRDPSVCLGPDGTYYLTGTSEPFWGYNNENGIRVWKSRDMVKWEPLGTVWRYGESPWHKPYLEAKKPLWAPEIHYKKGTFWLTYSMPGWQKGDHFENCGSGLLRSTTGKPEGPYADVSPNEPLGDEIDASLFEDDDGTLYFLWHRGMIRKMKPDLSGPAEPMRKLTLSVPDPDPGHHTGLCAMVHGRDSFDHIGYEGVFLFKIGDTYILSGSDQFEGKYTCWIATSKSLYGPYGARYPAIPFGGHNMFFKDTEGKWWSTIFNGPINERPCVLPVVIESNGQVSLRGEK